ncbi:hypothetical protein GCM10007386_50050 [Pseudoduganella dura]|nr:hypothetical protein GCM10007386_50050 [Pseudoduganella dura]
MERRRVLQHLGKLERCLRAILGMRGQPLGQRHAAHCRHQPGKAFLDGTAPAFRVRGPYSEKVVFADDVHGLLAEGEWRDGAHGLRLSDDLAGKGWGPPRSYAYDSM